MSQNIVDVETEWSDSFKEWKIHSEGDSLEGKLEMLWKINNDWTQWTFEFGELTGRINQKFNNPEFWEIRAGDEIITAKTVWSGDRSAWRFTDGKHIIRLKSKYYDLPWLWYSKGEEHGYIDIYREYEEDPRLWLVDDFLDEEISVSYKIALIFITLYHSTPKY